VLKLAFIGILIKYRFLIDFGVLTLRKVCGSEI